jgi:quinolinate synthase
MLVDGMTHATPTTGTSSSAPTRDDVRKLLAERNAVLFAHYYQESEIQDLADFVGDSLELARRAMETDADVIVLAGVHFMAETAKILSPAKTVLLPDLNAGCSLAESAPAYLFRAFRERHPDHLALTYINCTAEVKALSDIIVTSSSAERILAQIPKEMPILFSPDKNLGRYLARKYDREMLLWQGTCSVHEQFSGEKIRLLKLEHPGAEVLAHPECEDVVLELADMIGSTSALLAHTKQSAAQTFIVATEVGILHQMQRARPDRTFIAAPPEGSCACNECPFMKLNTLEKLHACLRDMSPRIELPDALIAGARASIDRMLALAGPDASAVRDRVLGSIRLPFTARP